MLSVILTGGASKRMGRDKAMLPCGEKTLLQNQIDRFSEIGPVAVSVDRAGRFAFTGAAELIDPYPGMGPLNGVVAGLSCRQQDQILLVGVDMPFADPGLALRLAELCGNYDACIIQYGKKGLEPLFGIYRSSCSITALDCLRDGELSLRSFLSRLHVRKVLPEEVPDFELERILYNMNTPDDYMRIR